MLNKLRWLARFMALVAVGALGASTCRASVHFDVGKFKLDEDPVPFVASWLHDASSSPSEGASVFGPNDNRAFRTGNTSSRLVGSFDGDFDSSSNTLSNIRGVLSGTTKMLLDNFDGGNNLKDFKLKIGQEAGAGKNGKLAFETEGPGEYTGGYIDYVLAVDVDDNDVYVDVLSGTFFFKPQGENSNSLLSPNRGDVSEFMLWGYNYMHDSFAHEHEVDGTVDWATFFATLGGYSNNVTRPNIDQTLGISLYVTSGTSGHNPEPTALVIWGILVMVGGCFSGRCR